MKPRSKPLVLTSPLPARYWNVTVEDRGVHTFRHPYYGVAAAVVETLAKHPRVTEDASEQGHALALLPMAGLLIGCTWSHTLHELETPLPLSDLSAETLTRYGEAVADELQEAGYDLLTQLELLTAIAPEMTRRQSITEQAMARSSFSAAPKAGSMDCS